MPDGADEMWAIKNLSDDGFHGGDGLQAYACDPLKLLRMWRGDVPKRLFLLMMAARRRFGMDAL